MYEVIVAPEAQKGMKHLKSVLKRALTEAVKDLKDDPFSGKPLSRELAGRYTYRIGVFRIIYTINKQDRKVYIIGSGHRATVYS